MASPTKKKSGPKPREWTEQERLLVKFMAVAGVDHKSIAKAVKTDDKTLRKYFKEELDHAADRLNAQVVGALFKNALAGNVSAQIFWCKTRLGWREVDRHELTGEGGGSIIVQVVQKGE